MKEFVNIMIGLVVFVLFTAFIIICSKNPISSVWLFIFIAAATMSWVIGKNIMDGFTDDMTGQRHGGVRKWLEERKEEIKNVK